MGFGGKRGGPWGCGPFLRGQWYYVSFWIPQRSLSRSVNFEDAEILVNDREISLDIAPPALISLVGLTCSKGTFAATKRSEEIMAETLRLELAPFHVNVLSVVTGALKTRGQSHFDDWKLPEGSLYKPVESLISDRARGKEGAPRMEAADYAERVVSEIIKGKTGKFWYGASAGMVKFGTTWLATSLMVRQDLPLRYF